MREPTGTLQRRAESLDETMPGSDPKHIFWRADARGEWIEAIPPWGEFTGLDPREARGDAWLELLHPADRARTAALWKHCVASREPYQNEYRLRRPGGGWRHIAVRGVPMLAVDGSVREWIGMSEDITESRLDRQALAHERIMLEQLVRGGSLTEILTELVVGHEQLHAGAFGSIHLCDAEGKLLLHGAAPSLPAEYSKSIHGAAIGPNAGSCGTAAFTGETVIVADIETDPRWVDHKHLALPYGLRACWSTPIRSRSGKVRGTFALYYKEPRTPHPEELAAIETGARLASVAIERKFEGDAALEWKNRYDALIKASGHLIYDWDPVTNQVTYGGDSHRILGYPLEELGSTLSQWKALVHPEDRAAFEQSIERAVLAEHSFHDAYRVRRRDGVYVDVQDDGYFARNAEGGVTRMLGFIVDVTERKRSEEQARQTQKMNAIGELAGGVAHDFNNQLAAILGYADLLSQRLEHPDLVQLSDAIGVAARRSADLTQKLLAFARKGQYRKVPIDVHKLIAETVTILERSIDKRIAIVQRLEAPGAVISGDPSQIQNALLNLGLNARDAMIGGGTLTFETSIVNADSSGRRLRIAVSDTGSGISDEIREHLFEPFFTTKSIGKGTGMGLASVYGTVERHAGMIRVDGAEGVGTTFIIYLPLAEQAVPEPAAPEPPRPAAASALRILVVDDEEDLRSMIPRMLQRANHQATAVADGREAVDLYSRRWREFDLVMLDMMMPGISGRDTFRALRAINPGVRVLLSSGYSIDGDAREILDDGAEGFIQKPFTTSELEEAIAEIGP
jgi:PAS domain S-box-containing protein